MDQKISFERFLFGEGKEIVIDDFEFCVDRVVILPKIRPHQLEKAVDISVEYCQIPDFRRKLLEKYKECPVLIYKLYKRGILVFEEIEPFFGNEDSFLFCYYFRKEIKDFDSFVKCKDKPYGIDESFFENENEIDQLIEYGYVQSSIEYYLKYDVIDDLAVCDNINQEARWSPFEWSYQPKYLDLLSFAGFFGSIKCFKHLLMEGFEIKDNVLSMVVCSGCFDLFHLCQNKKFLTLDHVCKASEFFHLPLIVFMIENGVDNIGKDEEENTPLYYAVANGHLSVVEYLVNQKADINARSEYYATPLHRAAANGHLSVVEYLVNQKADVNAKDKDDVFFYRIILLFIMLLLMVILVLLNILLIKKLI